MVEPDRARHRRDLGQFYNQTVNPIYFIDL